MNKNQIVSNRNGKQHISFSDNNEDLARYLQLVDNAVQRFMGSHQCAPAGFEGLGIVHALTPLLAALLLDGHCGMEESEPQNAAGCFRIRRNKNCGDNAFGICCGNVFVNAGCRDGSWGLQMGDAVGNGICYSGTTLPLLWNRAY